MVLLRREVAWRRTRWTCGHGCGAIRTQGWRRRMWPRNMRSAARGWIASSSGGARRRSDAPTANRVSTAHAERPPRAAARLLDHCAPGCHPGGTARRAADRRRRPDVAAARRRWRDTQPLHDARGYVFVDESGVTTDLLRRYGRSPRGVRLRDYTPCGHWQTHTIIAALRVEGLQAPAVFDGPPRQSHLHGLRRAKPGTALRRGRAGRAGGVVGGVSEGFRKLHLARGGDGIV